MAIRYSEQVGQMGGFLFGVVAACCCPTWRMAVAVGSFCTIAGQKIAPHLLPAVSRLCFQRIRGIFECSMIYPESRKFSRVFSRQDSFPKEKKRKVLIVEQIMKTIEESLTSLLVQWDKRDFTPIPKSIKEITLAGKTTVSVDDLVRCVLSKLPEKILGISKWSFKKLVTSVAQLALSKLPEAFLLSEKGLEVQITPITPILEPEPSMYDPEPLLLDS